MAFTRKDIDTEPMPLVTRRNVGLVEREMRSENHQPALNVLTIGSSLILQNKEHAGGAWCSASRFNGLLAYV